jgi:hypothetical protein
MLQASRAELPDLEHSEMLCILYVLFMVKDNEYVSKYCAALRFAPHVSLYLHSACGPHSRPRAFMHAEQPSTLLVR